MSRRSSSLCSPLRCDALTSDWGRPAGEPQPVFGRQWWCWVLRWMHADFVRAVREAGGLEIRERVEVSSRQLLVALTLAGILPAVLGFVLTPSGVVDHALAGL